MWGQSAKTDLNQQEILPGASSNINVVGLQIKLMLLI
jgi:hypothetical protein